MENKVVIDFTSAVKELILNPQSWVANIMKDLRKQHPFVDKEPVLKKALSSIEMGRNTAAYTPLMKQLEMALRNPKANDEFFNQMYFMLSLSEILNDTYLKKSDFNTNTLQAFLLRFHDIKDAHVAYNAALLLRKYAETVWGRENPLCRQIITLVANQSLATIYDIALLFQVSPKEHQADIFAKLETCARREIREILESPVPNTQQIKYIIQRVQGCAVKLYGIYSEEYKKICQEYSEEKFLTPNAAKYISSMPDVFARQVTKLEAENTKLRAEIDALKAESDKKTSELSQEKMTLQSNNSDLRQKIKLYEEKIVDLLYAIQRTRPSLFSRGVKAAQQRAGLIEKELKEKIR